MTLKHTLPVVRFIQRQPGELCWNCEIEIDGRKIEGVSLVNVNLDAAGPPTVTIKMHAAIEVKAGFKEEVPMIDT